MTPAQIQSRLRFTAQELTREAQHWPRQSVRRRNLSRSALELARCARACRPGIPDNALRGANALIDAATNAIVDAALARSLATERTP